MSSSVELPNELQHLIFVLAARSDGTSAINLVRVARYVHGWIRPLIFETVVIRGPQTAMRLLQTIRQRPKGYFNALVKSLAFSDSVMLPLALPIFEELSTSILSFAILRTSDYPDNFLRYIPSSRLRHLTMIFKRVQGTTSYSWETPYEIPLDILPTLTHLIIVIDYLHDDWRTPSQNALFSNLECFAISESRWQFSRTLLSVAKRLRCFAILADDQLHRGVDTWFTRLARTSARTSLLSQVRQLDDHRLVLITQGELGDPEHWYLDECLHQSSFWERAENLVREGFVSDAGDRWPDQDP